MSPNVFSITLDSVLIKHDETQVRGSTGGTVYLFYAPVVCWLWDGDKCGQARKLWVYCHQSKEGMQSWYAFDSAQGRQMFVDLIGFEGIGPGIALKILSKTHYSDIAQMVDDKDKEAFLKLPVLSGKLGAKVAEVWFKDAPAPKSKIMPDADAVGAMVSLGMKKTEATEKVLAAMAASPGATTEQLVKLCLRK